MNPKDRARLLLLLLALICGGAVWGVIWYRARPIKLADLYKRMPVRDSVLLYVDVRALERAGLFDLLSASKVAEDPEYRHFVERTEFDYTEDLDSALVAFAPDGKYLLVNGRFDWKKLREFAKSEGGACATAMCSMQGSTPERRISFSPLQDRVMAMAVSTSSEAVKMILPAGAGPDPQVPSAPIWLRIPGTVLRSEETLPTGTQMFARTVQRASGLTLTFAPEGDHLAARLEVSCENPQDAISIAADLSNATKLLRQMIERENHHPNPEDLSGVLASGSFRSERQRVYGYWPIDRRFVVNVLSGGVK